MNDITILLLSWEWIVNRPIVPNTRRLGGQTNSNKAETE